MISRKEWRVIIAMFVLTLSGFLCFAESGQFDEIDKIQSSGGVLPYRLKALAREAAENPSGFDYVRRRIKSASFPASPQFKEMLIAQVYDLWSHKHGFVMSSHELREWNGRKDRLEDTLLSETASEADKETMTEMAAKFIAADSVIYDISLESSLKGLERNSGLELSDEVKDRIIRKAETLYRDVQAITLSRKDSEKLRAVDRQLDQMSFSIALQNSKNPAAAPASKSPNINGKFGETKPPKKR